MYDPADGQGRVLFVGFAGGRSCLGLRGELGRTLARRRGGTFVNLDPSDEQRLLIDLVRRFVREEIVPLEHDLDPDEESLPPGVFPRLVKKTRAMGAAAGSMCPRIAVALGLISSREPCFIVDTDTPGFRMRRAVHTARSAHDATERELDKVRAPEMAIWYARSRETFGAPPATRQAVPWTIVARDLLGGGLA